MNDNLGEKFDHVDSVGLDDNEVESQRDKLDQSKFFARNILTLGSIISIVVKNAFGTFKMFGNSRTF